jgi:purine-cytosine permease-like protein
MAIGSCLAAWAGASFSGSGILELHNVGDKFFSGFGDIVLLYAAVGVISVTALNMYGGSLTLISAMDSFTKVRPTLRVRLVMIGITALLSLVVAWAFANNGSFQADFNNFLLLVLYFFIPWTAVNLVDYFIVRRGHYAIAEIFKPNGIYGRWGWRGIVSYLVGFFAMTPFFSTEHYSGWVANAAHGADFSLFVGLPVAGLLYWLLSRSIDTEAERRLAEEQAGILEREAMAHQRTDG